MDAFLDFISGGMSREKLLACIIRLSLSFICGVCIGWERKNRQQIIGIRTLLLICISSTLMGILSEYAALLTAGSRGDPGRIAAAVITGIGFVGGGAIMHRGLNVKGVTTAALIWATAAIGLSFGFGMYVPALFVFVLILVSLPLFRRFEYKFFGSSKIKVLTLAYGDSKIDFEKVKLCIQQEGLSINDISILSNDKKGTQEFTLYVNVPENVDVLGLHEKLNKTGELLKFSFTES